MKKARFLILLISVIIILPVSFTGCLSTNKETFLTGGPETQTLIPNIKLSSESFLGTGIQMPSAEVIRSISIDNDNEGYHNNQTGIFIIDSKKDIGKFLDFLNGLEGNVEDIDGSYTFVTFYKIEFTYNEGVDSSLYVDSLQFGFQTFRYSSHVLGVTNFSCEEIWDKFESYCINPK